MAEQHILCINAGSSSVKTALFRVPPGEEPRRLAAIDASGIGEDDARLVWRIDGRRHREGAQRLDTHQEALGQVLEVLRDHELPRPSGLGHRIVRSPRGRSSPMRLTTQLEKALEEMREIAPLHIPHELEAIAAASNHFPGVAQVVCFDNHFFANLPMTTRRLPLPRSLDEAGIERIGYHGLSYEYILYRLGPAPGRTVIAHLGNGASMAAVRAGRPVDTTMSYTPSGGLMMGSRTGDLDPGVLIELMRRKGLGADELERLVNYQSGLIGVSGGEGSMKTLLARAQSDRRAEEAIELFCYIARKHLGSMITALGGIDDLIFTGGIGENAPEVRARILTGLDDLGLMLDEAANSARTTEISSKYSRARIRVIPTDEDWVIARHASDLLARTEDR